MFTGRRVDILDNGSLKIQYNRNRYLDYYTGRWLTPDPLGIVPNGQGSNYFMPKNQYLLGHNLYEYVTSQPIIGTDSLGLFVPSYKLGYADPPDLPFLAGDWRVEIPGIGKKIYYMPIQNRAFLQAWAFRAILPNASKLLRHYLGNTGDTIENFPYLQMVLTSKSALNHYTDELNFAIDAAEKLFQKNPTRIVNIKYYEAIVGPGDPDWWLSLQTYKTWGKAIVRKGKKAKSCCYTMGWTLYLRDTYEFENRHNFAGLVWDDDMWELNYYGLAQHFKVEGKIVFGITWPKGYRFNPSQIKSSLKGKKIYVFPQCR